MSVVLTERKPLFLRARRVLRRESCTSPLSSSKWYTLPTELLELVCSFLDQQTGAVTGRVCKGLREAYYASSHFTSYVVYNAWMAHHAQKQNRLEALAIKGTRDVQLLFRSLPPYVFLGHYSSFCPQKIYRHTSIPTDTPIPNLWYCNVRVMFIEEAHVEINWALFPNLEELYILTSQLDISLQGVTECTKLRKLIVKVRKGITYVDPRVAELPCLEVLAISGSTWSGTFRTVSPNLQVCVLFAYPEVEHDSVLYKSWYTNEEELNLLFSRLIAAHHRPPEGVVYKP
jgi:hypothetical protein